MDQARDAGDAGGRRPFDGRARWIWSAEGVSRPRPDAGAFRVRYFRRTFDAPAGARLVVHATADSRYKLWCNGVLVCRGPAKGDVVHQFYDTLDVSRHLRPGRNVLAAQVEYYGDVFCDYGRGGASVSQMTACPGFVLDGDLCDAAGGAGGGVEPLHTDGRWRVLVDGAYRHQMEGAFSHCVGLMEDFDCARYPWGFTDAAFDDSAWPAACQLDAAVPLAADRDSFMPHRLLPRMIAQLEESAPRPFAAAFRSPTGEDLAAWSAMLAGRGAVEVRAGREAVVLLDAGELTTGYPRLAFAGGTGATVALRYAEALTEPPMKKGRRDDLSFGDVRGVCDIFRPDGPAREVEPFFWRTFRFVRVEIRTAGQPLTIRSLRYAFTGYPLRALAEFESDDPDCRAIWEVSWRTARLCAHETYEDCPYFEQLQYGGDTQVQAMVSLIVAGDASLVRQYLHQFDWSRTPDGLTRSRYPSRVPQTIPFFSLHWVMAIADYWRHTGDRETLDRLLPGVHAVMDHFHHSRTPEGIIGRLRGWQYADWCPQWPAASDGSRGVPPGCDRGCGAFASMIAAATLRAAAELAEAGGEDAAGFHRRAADLRAAAHAAFYDERLGLYRDQPDREGASAYTNAMAILAGMPADHAAIAERIVSDRGLCGLTYFSTYFAWRALAAAGRYERMGRLLGPWREMLGMGLTTWMEDPRGDRSDCHAWGCGPMIEFCREVLGVRPLAPGYAVIGIEPHPAGLSWARGRVPLTRLTGEPPPRFVQVDWRIDSGRFRLTARSPEGIPCRVRLPDGSTHEFPDGGEISF